MEELLDLADALAQSSSQPVRPDFPMPEEYAHLSNGMHSLLTLQEIPGMGRGWVATQDIPVGTLLMAAKPVAMVMDWQDDTLSEEGVGSVASDEDGDDDEPHEEKENRLNELLLLQILDLLLIEPAMWTQCLTTLYPRDEDIPTLPAWVCQDDDVFLQVESRLELLRSNSDVKAYVPQIAKRLPLIILYNVLSVETSPELLSYPGPKGHSNLQGSALYRWPSFFNHSKSPTCSRWAVGDIMCFYANQDIETGSHVCISYIEHDVLCESAWRRNELLLMNFSDVGVDSMESAEPSPDEVEGPDIPVVDAAVQNELMGMDPFERLNIIQELNQQALGIKTEAEAMPIDKIPTGSDADGPCKWFRCDVQNLRILKAITLEGLGQSKEALLLWQECVDFVERFLPPNDESLIVVRVQAALCALHVDHTVEAKRHGDMALHLHQLVFGGGVERFRRRYQHDIDLQFRPTTKQQSSSGVNVVSPIDILWPVER